jgi:hypothetical protein
MELAKLTLLKEKNWIKRDILCLFYFDTIYSKGEESMLF